MIKEPGNDAVLRKRRREPPAERRKERVRLRAAKRKEDADGKKRLLCRASATVCAEHPLAYHARCAKVAPRAAVVFADFFIKVAARKKRNARQARQGFAVRFGKAEHGAGFFDGRQNGAARPEGIRPGFPVTDKLRGTAEPRIDIADQDAAVFLYEAASARSLPAKLCSSTIPCAESHWATRILSVIRLVRETPALSVSVTVFIYMIVYTARGMCQMMRRRSEILSYFLPTSESSDSGVGKSVIS